MERVEVEAIILTNNYWIKNLISKQDLCQDKAEPTIIKAKVQETRMNAKKFISLILHRLSITMTMDQNRYIAMIKEKNWGIKKV